MAPTLIAGDHFYVDKSAFGRREPERGEVVVFLVARGARGEIHPRDEQPGLPAEQFVKRIVGLPGDVLESVEGELHVNGVAAPRRETGETFRPTSGGEAEILEEVLGDRRFRIARDPHRPGKAIERTTVPAGRYFVMGDFRGSSRDSRYWGTVARADLIGPATWIYWSVPPDGYAPRWGRLGGVE